ncbi:Hypothetical protein AKI40_3056 [Enterobacter sp. FY-07]|nr:Hypothetical protein AKI40_3056 [Enterobacter sp. FY-07]
MGENLNQRDDGRQRQSPLGEETPSRRYREAKTMEEKQQQ